MGSVTPEKQTRLDIQAARRRAEIDVPLVRSFIHGSQEAWEEHSRMVDIFSKDLLYDPRPRPYMTREERVKNSLKLVHKLHELQDKHRWSDEKLQQAFHLMGEGSGYGLHFLAFEPVLKAQASNELLEEYGELAAKRGIIGCYLQTELAHGSNVNGLETTATYLPETRQFEINSPTLTSRKYWVGGAGKLATHGVVQAKLILPGGKDMGPHLFFVQLRSLEDHRTLPGITLGDIGPKAMGGAATIDNGYATFDHIRIPARFMLSKFAHVTPNGHYVQPPHAKISYGGMLYIRSTMVTTLGWSTAKAVTIAIRYATVRRQGSKTPEGLEQQIITYPAVYNRLLPILARAYTFLLLGRNLNRAFATMAEQLANRDTSLLAEMHATTSGLKVWATTTAIQDMETARRCLGGHGYSEYAGIGRIYANNLPSATYEGDNFILDLQVVRAAVKAYQRYSSNSKPDPSTLSPTTAYLRLLSQSSRADTDSGGWVDPHFSAYLLEQRALCMVREFARNQDDPDASAQQRVARAVTEAFVATQVEAFVRELPSQLPGKDAHVVKDLLTLFLLTTVEAALVDLLSFNLLPRNANLLGDDPTRDLRKAVQHLELKLLPQAIGLSDAFGFADWELDSALGVYDGAVYEALLERTKDEPLNRTDVVDGYEEYVKPVLERGRRLAMQSGVKL